MAIQPPWLSPPWQFSRPGYLRSGYSTVLAIQQPWLLSRPGYPRHGNSSLWSYSPSYYYITSAFALQRHGNVPSWLFIVMGISRLSIHRHGYIPFWLFITMGIFRFGYSSPWVYLVLTIQSSWVYPAFIIILQQLPDSLGNCGRWCVRLSPWSITWPRRHECNQSDFHFSMPKSALS